MERKDPDQNAPASNRDTDRVTPSPIGDDQQRRQHDMTDPADRTNEQVEGAGQAEPSDPETAEKRRERTESPDNPVPTKPGAPDDTQSAATNRSPVRVTPHVQPRPGMAVKYIEAPQNDEGEQRLIAATIASVDESAVPGSLESYRVSLNLWRTNDDPLWRKGSDSIPNVDYGTEPGNWTEST